MSSADNDSGNESHPVRGLGLSVHGDDEALDTFDSPPLPDETDKQRTKAETFPFPRLVSPTSPQPPLPFPSKDSSSPTYYRSPTSSIVRKSNGQPLKPSLKVRSDERPLFLMLTTLSQSSVSSGNIPSIATSNLPRSFTRSAPATPSVKAVHFAEKDGVVVFEKSQRPVAVSLGGPAHKNDDTETETERDAEGSEYPLPTSSPTSIVLGKDTSAIPSIPYDSIFTSDERVHLETIALPPSHPSCLRGSVLVQNVSFTKQVYVRFTLDDWQTTSEVGAKYSASVPNPVADLAPTATHHHVRSLSEPPLSRTSSPVPEVKQWDRFDFVIKLEDVRNLETRKMSLVVRFVVAEWNWAEFWDNNRGQNYQIVFEKDNAPIGSSLSSKPVSPVSANALPLDTPALSTASSSVRPIPLLPPPSMAHSHANKYFDTKRGFYPSHHLRLSHYISPVSSVSPVVVPHSVAHSSKEQSTPAGPAPISPPDTPLIPRRKIIGGQLATVEDVPTATFVQSMPVKVLTPPESKESTPEMLNLPLPFSKNDAAVPSTRDDSQVRPSAGLNKSSRLADGSSEQESSPSSGSVTPTLASPPRSNEAKQDETFGMSPNNAPPEFLKRFCFFGSATPASPSLTSMPSFVFGTEIVGGSTLTMGQAGVWGERWPQIIHAGPV